MKSVNRQTTPAKRPSHPPTPPVRGGRLRGAVPWALVCLVCLASSGAEPRGLRPGRRPMPRQAMIRQYTDLRQRNQAEARAAALQEGWAPRGTRGRVRYELMAIRGNVPYVFKTRNLEAGVSVAVDSVRAALPGILGQTQTVGVWDAGDVLSTHQELSGRVLRMEQHGRGPSAEPSSHATHVAGTIAAAGVNPAALGMAPAAQIASYNYNRDLGEVARRAMSDPNEADMIQVSNHSYGYACGWDYTSTVPRWYGEYGDRQSALFGQYDQESQSWDQICYEAPYYLSLRAAGNDRGDQAPSDGTQYEYYQGRRGWISKRYDSDTDPGDDGADGGYDSTPPDGTAKNVMTVGAVQAAVSGAVRDVNAAAMTSFSSWGPTDDGRVKPDAVACGVRLLSCSAEGDDQYDTYSGTSMAVASATGGAALLLDLHQALFPGQVMRSATLKGLLLHTADDLGNPGPDYQFGWGLLNIRAAAALLLEQAGDAGTYRVVEDVLDAQAPERAYALFIGQGQGALATLCWTDPPATVSEDPDSSAPCLVNDLDLRIMDPQGSRHLPYVLDRTRPAEPAVPGDNTLDNVEQVRLPGPLTGGWITVSVSHKGVLRDGEQAFSLLVSVL